MQMDCEGHGQETDSGYSTASESFDSTSDHQWRISDYIGVFDTELASAMLGNLRTLGIRRRHLEAGRVKESMHQEHMDYHS